MAVTFGIRIHLGQGHTSFVYNAQEEMMEQSPAVTPRNGILVIHHLGKPLELRGYVKSITHRKAFHHLDSSNVGHIHRRILVNHKFNKSNASQGINSKGTYFKAVAKNSIQPRCR